MTTIETVLDLHRLPWGAIVLDRDGDAWQFEEGGWTCTDRSSNTVDQPPESLLLGCGPLRLIYDPTQHTRTVAQVKAEAWDEGYAQGRLDSVDSVLGDAPSRTNPYRADELERGDGR